MGGSTKKAPITITWICDHELAHSIWPELNTLDHLCQSGIRVIVSLQYRNLIQKQLLLRKGFEYFEMHVKDGTAPTIDQLEQINRYIDTKREEKKPVLVHCY